MRGTRRAAVAAMAITLAGLLAACGGDDSAGRPELQPLPERWAAADRAEVRRIARSIRSAGSERCSDVGFVSPADLARGRALNDWRIAPRAIGTCDIAGEAVEVGVFASADDRDRFMDERTTVLCRKAAAVGVEVAPFSWAYGGTWSLQADEPRTARASAARLDGETRIRRCDSEATLGWTRAGVRVVRRLVADFSDTPAEQVPCSGFALVDRDRVLAGADRGEVPAALGTCTIIGPEGATGSGTQTAYVAAFDRRSMRPAAFVGSLLDGPGACRYALTAVAGDGWVVVAPSAVTGAVVDATGGTVLRGCEPRAGSTGVAPSTP